MIDYSLYLVTGRDLVPYGLDYLHSLEEAIKGGVTVVQIREKNVETREFLRIARDSQVICKKYNVPIIINDRVDIALAIGADGVHLGQTDMPINVARSLLPKNTIIGVSCNNVEDIRNAVRDGADYVGIGAVWGTSTKVLTSPIVGVRSVGIMLNALEGTQIKAVAIGGIKSSNLLRTLHGCVSPTNRALDGVAVVSEIVGSPEPCLAAQSLSEILKRFRTGSSADLGFGIPYEQCSPDHILNGVLQLISEIRKISPLVHQITNTVVSTQSANATLALGASPIMATAPQEMEDLARVCGALLVNIGTLREEGRDGMLKAGQSVNAVRKPIVLDPVGVGATEYRKTAVKELLNMWQATVIKGNGGELAALAGSTEIESKGVDSVGSGFKDPISFVRALARKERCIIVLTGPIDYISDGSVVVSLKNGHEMLGRITGSGCMVGTCIAAFAATAAASIPQSQRAEGRLVDGDMLIAAAAGVLALTIAAELAMNRGDVKGPGSFLPVLMDELANLKPEVIRGLAKVEVHL